MYKNAIQLAISSIMWNIKWNRVVVIMIIIMIGSTSELYVFFILLFLFYFYFIQVNFQSKKELFGDANITRLAINYLLMSQFLLLLLFYLFLRLDPCLAKAPPLPTPCGPAIR